MGWVAIIVTITFILMTTVVHFTTSYDILAIYPFSGKSHFYMLRTITDELVNRGHNVTLVSHFPKNLKQENHDVRSGTHTDYSLAGSVPIFENLNTDEVTGSNFVNQVLMILEDGLDNCEGVMSSGRLDQLIRSRAKFDLVLVEIFNTGCFVPVANHFGSPIIGVTSTNLYPWYSSMVGDVVIPSYIPVNLLPFTTRMTFVERIINTAMLMTIKIYYKYIYEPKAQEIVDKYLDKLNVSIPESMKKVNAIIVNTHFVFGDARPIPPGIIEVGGCSYKSPKPLPKNLEQYVTSAERGVIYFSMGSIVKGSSMPAERSLAMLRAFGRLEGYKVLWKWEDDPPPLEVRPKNVMFVPWTPQFDVLNHPNVKLFMSHGGLMGILDALYSGKPIIGIPLFADQFSNVNFIVQNKCGLQLKFDEIDEQNVYETITTILENNIYAENAKTLSLLYQDRDHDPLGIAMYWIEYVARHRVDLLLKPTGQQLQWCEYCLLDVFVTVTGVAVTIAYLVKRFLFKKSRPTEDGH